MVGGVVREIRIYVEGGGNQAGTRAQSRDGMGTFLRTLRDCARRNGIRWNVIACGERDSAFDDFRHALTDHPGAMNVLLVDAEGRLLVLPGSTFSIVMAGQSLLLRLMNSAISWCKRWNPGWC